jgi:hypothetical protein
MLWFGQFGINVVRISVPPGSDGSSAATAAVAAKKGDIGAAFGAGLEFSLNDARNVRWMLDIRALWICKSGCRTNRYRYI